MTEVYVVVKEGSIYDSKVTGVFNADSVPLEHLKELFKKENGFTISRCIEVEKDTYSWEEPEELENE